MKRPLFIFFAFALNIALFFQLLAIGASAHSGKTDSNGGHYDHSTGEYHYHHGYPAHKHYDIDGDGYRDCPYEFDDKTNHNSSGNSFGNSFGNSSNNKTDINNNNSESDLTFGVVLEIIGISLLVLLLSSAFVFPLFYGLLDSLISTLTKKIFKTEPKESVSFIISIITFIIIVVTIVSIIVLES